MTIASHELALCEINNGKRYQQRCTLARAFPRNAARGFAEIAATASREYEQEFGAPADRGKIFSAEDILAAAVELEAYYRQHNAENDSFVASDA